MRVLRTTRFRAAGFTLVELLAVIAIIALLIAILVPTVGAVRRQTNVTATRATLQSISTGLETYRADGKLGGQYPPSRSDRGGTGTAQLQVNSPYSTTVNADIKISGAGLLVWAMVGADLLGTPGFRVVDPTDTTRTSWSRWTGQEPYDSGDPTGRSALYAMYPENMANVGGQPVHARSGPYVQLDKMKVTPRVSGTSSFTVEGDPTQRPYPMFVDSFGNPILYWRADPAGRRFIDKSATPEIASGGDRGKYHWIDNGMLLDNPSSTSLDERVTLLTDTSGTGRHRLNWESATGYTAGGNLPSPGTFANYILNREATAQLTPHRPDSYLLVTPGPDGIYGSADDIANFEHNGS